MVIEEVPEIEIRADVAIQQEEVLIQFAHFGQRHRRAQGGLLLVVTDLDSELAAVSDERHDQLGLVAQHDGDVLEAVMGKLAKHDFQN